MKHLFVLLFIGFVFQSHSQTFDTEIQQSKSLLRNVNVGDSIVYYQCHVEEGTQQLITSSGQTLTGKPQPYTITEKFVITKNNLNFSVKYFTSSLTVFPNKKFSGLKIREKEYWQFKQDSIFNLNAQGLKILLSLENKGREAMEYDYPVTKYTTNQMIIKHHRDFKQLVIENKLYISKYMLATKN